MEPRRLALVVAFAALALAGLVLWWMTPGEDGPVIAKQVERPSVRAERQARPMTPRVVAPPVAPEGDSDAILPEGRRVYCGVDGLHAGDRVFARVTVDGAETKVNAVPLEDGVQLMLPDEVVAAVEASEGPAAVRLRVAKVGTVSGTIDWMRGEGCVVAALQEDAIVRGVVRTRRGLRQGRVRVVGCGSRAVAGPDGRFEIAVRLTGDTRDCDLFAVRQDGAFQLRSDPARVTLRSGQVASATLALSSKPAGGVGVHPKPHPHGIALAKVLDGSPAADAGLQAGDLVVAVDGIPAVELSLREFVDEAVGPDGSEVVYTILRDGEEVEVPMTREAREDRR